MGFFDALANIFTSSGNNNTQWNIQQSINKTNKEIADRNNQWNLDMWNRQNEYNSPSAQIDRYKQAGLNPALIYGNSGSAGNATSMPSASQYHAATPQGVMTPADAFNNIASAVSTAISLVKQFKEMKKLDAGTTMIETRNKYLEDIVQQQLLGLKTTNEYLPGYLNSRNEVAANQVFDSMYQSFLRKYSYLDKQDWYNNWRTKQYNQKFDIGEAQLGLIGKQKQHYDDQHQLYTIQKPYFQALADKLANDAAFDDSDIFRGINKGMGIIGQLVDVISGGITGFGKLKGILTPPSRLKGKRRHGKNGFEEFYDYE